MSANSTSTKNKFPVVIDGVAYNVYATYPDVDTEVYTYKLNGVTMKVATVIYTDATKAVLTSVEWT